jgi:hypothetical protein
MKTAKYFMGNGTIEQRNTILTLSKLVQREKEFETALSNLEGVEVEIYAENILNGLEEICNGIACVLEYAVGIGMEDTDIILINYKQYVGASINSR